MMSAYVDERPQGCVAVFLNLFRSSTSTLEAEPTVEALPYRIRSDFLSPAELSFYHVLASVVGDQAVISTKVRLADLFFVPQNQERQRYQNKIAQKHLDFLLCDPQTMRPLLGIELDDKSHERKDRQERDTFVDGVFEAAGVPLIHILARQTYNPQEIRAQILPLLIDQLVVPPQPAPTIDLTASSPVCPTCDIPMIRRTSSRGQNQGKQFWGCQNYPKCRSMVAIA
jgi:hypothetical protein